MTKQMKQDIRDVYCDEREYGQVMCDFDDREHDLRTIARIIGIKMIYDEDEEKWIFASENDKTITNEALDYYYNLHGC